LKSTVIVDIFAASHPFGAISLFHYNNTPPKSIKIPDIEKINGHNLYGKKLTLKPVKSDKMAMENRKHGEEI
jgi:hypothetical protein